MPRPLVAVITHDEADLIMLGRASEEGKFAVPCDMRWRVELQSAIERGLHHDWFRLIDVTYIQQEPHRLMRIFRLTEAGKVRVKELRDAGVRDMEVQS